MTLISENWNQVVRELNDWYKFGRELEQALNSEGNRSFDVVG
jgi:hypothetical protein